MQVLAGVWMATEEPPTAGRRTTSVGARARRPSRRRALRLRDAIVVTSLSALLPGTGYIYNGRRALGLAVLIPSVTIGILVGWLFPHNLHAALDFAFDPKRLKMAAALLAVALLAWIVVVVTTYLMVRPVPVERWKTWVGGVFVGVLCIAVAAPVTVAARYAMIQADLVETVFSDAKNVTTPKHVTEKDPWAGRRRVNLLLLGGDGGAGRIGVRTDSMILVSIDTRTGRTVTFSLPRNMMYAQFPRKSPLHRVYPYGFTGEGDPGNWMLNAVYREVPLLHPGILGHTDNEGADAIKLAVRGTTGINVDYYMLANLAGFRELVDAMGGVTVNINTPVAIGGSIDHGTPPDGYLKPGPNQHLNGYQALWFTRGRWGSDDYQRMERQRCMIHAIIDDADPLKLLRRYQALAAAGKKLIHTDIPRKLVPAFVDLALKVKEHPVKSVVFRPSDEFNPGDPDFAWLRETVRKALSPHHKKEHRTGRGAVDDNDACAYSSTSPSGR
jgi:polyisoprenyl-teichoic acid--peptidoglycan teichoic acid transferase